MSALDDLPTIRRAGCGLPRVQRTTAPDGVRSPHAIVAHPLDAFALGLMPWGGAVAPERASGRPPCADACGRRARLGCHRCGRCAARRPPPKRGATGRESVPNVGRLWARGAL